MKGKKVNVDEEFSRILAKVGEQRRENAKASKLAALLYQLEEIIHAIRNEMAAKEARP